MTRRQFLAAAVCVPLAARVKPPSISNPIVPALLTPGEFILNRAQQAQLARDWNGIVIGDWDGHGSWILRTSLEE